MVESFPEIQSFFRKKEFSQEELDQLKENLLTNYGKDKNTLNIINSSINLNLIHYKTSGPFNKPLEKTKPPRPKKLSKKEKENRKKETYLEKFESKLIDNFLKYTINKPLKKAAIYLGMEIEDFKTKLWTPKEFERKNLEIFDNDLWVFNEKWIRRKLNYNRRVELSGKGEFTPEIFYQNAKGKSLQEVAKILGFRTPKFIQLCHLDTADKLPKSFNDKLWKKNNKWIKQRLQKLSKENLRSNPIGTVKRSNYSKTKNSGVYGELIKAKTIKSIIYTRM